LNWFVCIPGHDPYHADRPCQPDGSDCCDQQRRNLPFFPETVGYSELEFAVQAALEKYNLEAENRRLLANHPPEALDLKLLERQFRALPTLTGTNRAESSFPRSHRKSLKDHPGMRKKFR
jgi:hypothetical protein